MQTPHLFQKPLIVGLTVASLSISTAQTTTSKATEIRRFPAAEANQGVATDADFFYAIDDSQIGKYSKQSGQRVALWTGDPKLFIHINSCFVLKGELVCAMSNFPGLPQVSSVEWFNTRTMTHLRSHSFGQGPGSLTWIDWHDGSWWACFANYDGHGGDPTRDHTATTLVRYNTDFVRQASWLFPQDVLERFGRMSASGGRWGDNGLLYVTGHDLPEIYTLRLPPSGARLQHVDTFAIPTAGQAFDWDYGHPGLMWSIERKRAEAVESRLPVPAEK